MKSKKIKTIWNLGVSFFIGGLMLWIVETGIFLIIEGWHYKATNPIEIWFDKCVGNMWNCATMLIIYCLFQIAIKLSNGKKIKT